MKIRGFVDPNGCPRIPFRSLEGEKFYPIVDTGFNGSLCLPKNLIKALNFQYVGTFEIELADGSKVPSPVYLGEILWFQKKTEVFAYETVSVEGLVGTQLLRSSYFEFDMDANFVMITRKQI